MGEAIALDRRKDRIDRRRHCDNRNLPRRNAGEHANSGGAVDSIFHLRASPTSRALQAARETLNTVVQRKQWLRPVCASFRARMDAGEQGHPLHAQQRLKRAPRDPGHLLFQSSDSHAAIFAALPSRTTFLAVVMAIAGFIASGPPAKIDLQKPVLRLAPLIWTWSASWKLRWKFRSAMPW